jgi:D-serine deaminase-like pyridoxal phosphate-dependent protein
LDASATDLNATIEHDAAIDNLQERDDARMLESITPAGLKALLASERLPCALLDVDNFNHNLSLIREAMRIAGKKMRLCTKSIRVPELASSIARAELSPGLFVSRAAEALYYAEKHGVTDILVGYPPASPLDAKDLCAAKQLHGAAISVMVDCTAQLDVLEAAASEAGLHLDVIVDIDMADTFLANKVGTYRSPIHDPKSAVDLVIDITRNYPHLDFAGIMGYEAQNASIGDASSFMRLIKARSRKHVNVLRTAVVEALTRAGFPPRIVNGGGSGCYPDTAAEPSVTEIGLGSLLFKPHIFDSFRVLANFKPALFFAINVVRKPCNNIVTAFSGGYVSSGVRAQPIVYIPGGLVPLQREGFGEVQTPLMFNPKKLQLNPGDVILCRFGKAGEPLEHFNEVLAISHGKIENRYKTYRGLGLQYF